MRRLGKYELLERIGSGGMAEVYRARLAGRAGFQKTVVIKRLHQNAKDNPQLVQMFIDEANLAALIQHKNVVQVFELDQTEDGEYYLVMEFVAGSDLRLILRASLETSIRIPPWLSVHIACEILEGLAHAHELVDPRGQARGVIHRDVAPDNIFLSRLGDVKLGDFGIARSTKRKEIFAGHLKGKLPYMAPELLQTQPFDHRVDIFALGVVLWECLTQRRLFKRKHGVETVRLICSDDRLPPSMLAPGIPNTLDAVTLTALSSRPEDRFRDARTMHDRLLAIREELAPNLRPADVRNTLKLLIKDHVEEADDLIVEVSDDPMGSSSAAAQKLEAPTPWQGAPSLEAGWRTPTPACIDLSEEAWGSDRSPTPPMLFDTWDSGNYSIIHRTRPRDVLPPAIPPIEVPMRGEASNKETSELLPPPSDRIPMPGGPAMVETADILRRIEGADDYVGASPFWLDSVAGRAGPMAFSELMGRIRRERALRTATVRVSSNKKDWLSVPGFLELTGQEVEEPASPIRPSIAASLDASGLVRILVRLAREQATGRLVITQGSRHGRRRELHFSQGLPTYVSATDTNLQPPALLVEHKILSDDAVQDCLKEVILRQRPLEFLAAQRAGADVDRYRAFVMTLRLEDVFHWEEGQLAFDPHAAPQSARPFATSIITLLPLFIERCRGTAYLREAVQPHVNSRISAPRDFEWTLSFMKLKPGEIAWLKACRQFPTVGAWLQSSPLDERNGLVLAYLMLQLGLTQTASSPREIL